MSDFIGVDVVGVTTLQERIKKLPKEAGDLGAEESGRYLVNTLQAYAPQKSVTRAQAYGTPFFTDKQRRWFFANLRDGGITVPYQRTQTLRAGWQLVGKGQTAIVANETPYADLVMGDGQNRMHALIGWKKVSAIIQERGPQILNAFEGGVKKAIRKLGLA